MRKPKSTVYDAYLKPLLFGVLSGGVTCVLILLLSALLATMADIPHALVVPLALISVTAGAFSGAFAAAKIAGRNGWLVGIFNSIVLFLLSIISGWSYFELIDTGYIVIKALIMLGVGILGGIVAVNSGKKRA